MSEDRRDVPAGVWDHGIVESCRTEEIIMERFKNLIKKHPYLSQIVIALLLGLLIGAGQQLWIEWINIPSGLVVGAVFYAPFVIFPLLITIYEACLLAGVYGPRREEAMAFSRRISAGIYDLLILMIAGIYEYFFLLFSEDVVWNAGWEQQLYNAEKHAPLAPEHALTIYVIFALAAIGLFFLKAIKAGEVPPLVTVLAIAATYLGAVAEILLTYQVTDLTQLENVCLLLPPLNYFLILAREILCKMREYDAAEKREGRIDKIPFLGVCNRLLKSSKRWPLAALLLMWPLLGIVIVILLLFGQEPASAIKAFTETSDFRLSTKIAPQNLYRDEHYLCTVAAGGDRKIVRPLRKGVRHGHEVIVNRQLCVANAFEQILEERTPGLHRRIRNFYDTYGFPVAKLIKKRWMADLVYFMMKPLEWFFVAVLYLTEIHPEDRIALQYTGKGLRDFEV